MAGESLPGSESLLARAGFLRALVRDLVRDEHEANDVAQEVFLATWKRRQAGGDTPTAWLAAVARRIARRLYRDRTRRTRREKIAARRECEESTADTASRFELHRTLVDHVRALPEAVRGAILLRYFDGLAPREIAHRLDVPVSTVKTRLQRGLARLRRDLDRGTGRAAWSAIALELIANTPTVPFTLAAGGLMTSAAAKTAVVVLVIAAVTLYVQLSPTHNTTRSDRDGVAPLESVATNPNGQDGSAANPADALVPERLPSPVDLDACDRDLDLHGIVVRKDGSAVPGAQIEAVSFPWRRVWTGSHSRRDVCVPIAGTRSARDGTFSIRLAWGQAVSLRVSATGLAPQRLVQVTAGARVHVVLRRGVGLALTFRYTDRDRPAAGIAVRVREVAAVGTYPWTFGEEYRATTDAHGRAVFGGLTPQGSVLAQAMIAPRAYRIGLPEHGTQESACDIVEGRTVAGRITDAATNRPIGGARVRLVRADATGTMTGADGTYRLHLGGTGWAPGLVAEAPGYAARHEAVDAGGSIDFTLVRGATVRGRLLDHHGWPLADAHIVVVSAPDITRSTGSGSNGVFTIDDLVPDAWHTVVITGPGLPRTLLDFRPGDLGDVTLDAPGIVQGRVLDATGAPVPGAVVTLEGEGYARTLRNARPRDATSILGTREIRITDDLGRFRFTDQPAGMHTLRATRARATATAVAQIDERTSHARVDLRFTGGETIVRVRDKAGIPVAGARTWVTPWAGGKRARGVTDERGESILRLAGRANMVGVTARGRGFLASEPVHVQKGQRVYEFVLEKGKAVSGRIVLDGAPLEGRWYLDITAGDRRFAVPVTNGRFTVLVPPGSPANLTLRNTMRAPNRKNRQSRTIRRLVTATAQGVRPGTTGLVLKAERIPADQTLPVRVVSPSGQPLAGIRVVAGPVPQGRPDDAETDVSGRAAFEEVGALPTELTVALQDEWIEQRRWLAPIAIKVVPAGKPVELRLREANELHGVARGFPAGSRVLLLEAGRRLHGTRADATGRFTLLAPRGGKGPYEVRVVWSDQAGMFWSQSANVVGPETRLIIQRK